MAGMVCKKCGALMALSDKVCFQCGAEADSSQLVQLLLDKAEALREAERWQEACDQYRKALSQAAAPEQKIQILHKLGLALEKQARKQPAVLEEAGSVYEKALELDPSSEMLHQLWIANMTQRGLNGQALARYNKLLEADPGNEMAQRMKKVAALAAQFKLTPVQVMSSVAAAEARPYRGMLGWVLNPSPFKTTVAVASTVMNMAMCFYFAFAGSPGAHPAATTEEEALASSVGMGNIVQSVVGDPTFLFFSTLLTGVWAFYLIRAGKKKK